MDGALLALNPVDVIRAVNWSRPDSEVADFEETDRSKTQGKQGDETFHALMVALGDGYHSADELANSLALDVIEAHQALIQLEIDGQLTRYGHGHWARIRA